MRSFYLPLAFRCDRRWSELRPTADDKTRFCAGCAREVHWCADDDALRVHAERGDCVAIDPVYAREAAEASPALGEPLRPDLLPGCGGSVDRDR
jgi:hypothetical protein